MRIMTRAHPRWAASTRTSTSTPPTRSASTTRSSWSRSRPTSRPTSSTSCSELRATESSSLHAARHADLHLHRRVGRAGAGRARRRGPDLGHRPAHDHADHMIEDPRHSPRTTTRSATSRSSARARSGLIAAFWAGMREATSRIIDSLPEIGGQLTTLYPEKWIFDVPGYPRVLAKDLVEQLRKQAVEQFDVPVHLETTAERSRTSRPDDPSCVLHTDRRPAALAHGDHRWRPRRVRAEEAAGLRPRPRGRAGAPTTSSARSPSSPARGSLIVGGGDSACDWVDQPARHGRRDHAGAPPRGLPRARGHGRRDHAGRGGRHGRRPHALPDQGRGGQRPRSSASCCSTPRTTSEEVERRGRRDPAAARLQDRARPAQGVGAGDLEKGAIVVDPRDEDQPRGRLGVRRHHDLRRQAQADRHRLRRGGDRGGPGGPPRSAPTRRSSPSTRPTPACPAGSRATRAPRAPDAGPPKPIPDGAIAHLRARTRYCVA